MAKITTTTAAKPSSAAKPNTAQPVQSSSPVPAAAPAVPAAAPAATNPDGTPVVAKKRTGGVPKPRSVYPGLYAAATEAGKDPTRIKLKSIPDDYNPKRHKPMTRKDFEDESLFFELQAVVCERKAKKFREMATESKALGNVGDFKAAKKLLGMQKRMNEMVAALKADNPELNIDDMLSNLTKQLEADAAAAPPAAAPPAAAPLLHAQLPM